MPKTAREPALKPVQKSPPAVPLKSTFEGVQHTFKASKATAPDYPPAGPIGDLMAAEAMLDLLRLAVEKDFAGDYLECRQESAAVAAATSPATRTKRPSASKIVENFRISVCPELPFLRL